MHEQTIFAELGLVFVIVALVAGLMRYLRQPLILGYILTGILVGPLAFNIIHSKDAFEGFSQIGIALLLFIIGLGMNISVIKSLGKVSVLTALGTLLFVGGAGFVTSLAFGFTSAAALIIGVALFFSSTIIILKVLSDKREVSRLHGQVAIGVILVDDIVATIAIVLLSAFGSGESISGVALAWLALKALLLGGILLLVGAKIVPMISKKFAKNQELLFIFAIAWGFGIANLFHVAGFSHEVGALFAGVSLAGLPYAVEMSSRLKPLRDFFVILFFVSLGESFVFDNFLGILFPAIVLSIIVLLGKPLVVIASLGFLHYTKLTSFKAGVHLSQISEFSIVLVVLATQLELVDASATSLITLVALITIAASSYLMKFDDEIYRKIDKYLEKFERKNAKEPKNHAAIYHSILFGYHHGGHEFLQIFRKEKQKYLVVDHNPEIIEHLDSQGIRHAYGDASDQEFLEEINAGHAKFVASTIVDLKINRQLLAYLHRFENDTTFICHAQTYEDALELYEHGASYVILPRFLGSEYISTHIKRHGMDKKTFAKFRQKHIVSIGKHAVENS